MNNIPPDKNRKNTEFSKINKRDRDIEPESKQTNQDKEIGREALDGYDAVLGKSLVQRQNLDPKTFDPKALARIKGYLEALKDPKMLMLVESADTLGQKLHKKLREEENTNPYPDSTNWEINFVNEFTNNLDSIATEVAEE